MDVQRTNLPQAPRSRQDPMLTVLCLLVRSGTKEKKAEMRMEQKVQIVEMAEVVDPREG